MELLKAQDHPLSNVIFDFFKVCRIDDNIRLIAAHYAIKFGQIYTEF